MSDAIEYLVFAGTAFTSDLPHTLKVHRNNAQGLTFLQLKLMRQDNILSCPINAPESLALLAHVAKARDTDVAGLLRSMGANSETIRIVTGS